MQGILTFLKFIKIIFKKCDHPLQHIFISDELLEYFNHHIIVNYSYGYLHKVTRPSCEFVYAKILSFFSNNNNDVESHKSWIL